MARGHYLHPHPRKRKSRRYTYSPQPGNHPFYGYAPTIAAPLAQGAAAVSVDLRSLCLPIRRQLAGHSCSGYAFAALRELSHAVASGLLPGYLSAAYLWTQARMVEGNFPLDMDTISLADCASVIQNYGVCPESFFPETTDPSVAPGSAANTAAAQFRASGLSSVSTFTPAVINSVLSANPAQGVAVGIDVYDSFESIGPSGIIPMPGATEGLLGGHVVLLCGFDPIQSCWIVRNSQGTGWGDQGYGYMPYAYSSYWHEAWTITAQP